MLDKRLMGMSGNSMQAVWKNVAAQWLGLCCNIITVFAIAGLLDALLTGSANGTMLVVVLGVAVLCLGLRGVFTMASARHSHRASSQIKAQLRRQIYSKLLKLGPAYHQRIATSEAVQVTVEGVDQLEIYFGKYLPQLFFSLLAPLTLFSVMALVNLPSALVLLACVPLIPLSIIAVQKLAKKLFSKYWQSYTNLGDGFLENLQGLTTLKIYGSDEAKNEEMNQRAESFRKITMRVLVMQLNSVTLMDLIAYGGAAVGILVAIGQVVQGRVTLAGGLAIILLAADFFIPLRLLGSYFHIAMNGMAASEKIFRLLDMDAPAQGCKVELDEEKGICLQAAGYSYDGQRVVLQGVDLEAGPGMTAIVGESGSGKSTLAALLTGENAGYSGIVQLGGQELREIAPEALSKAVTLVPHNAYLFKGTVRENLLMACPEASDDALWTVLEQVKLHQFLMGEQGLDTPLAEKGANLSGGQRQRLALARAILHDTPVYIFDEATSNIDGESENDIMEVIGQMSGTKTVLIITHRLANVAGADCLYVVDGGRIVQQGTPGQLAQQQGQYAKMESTQRQLERYAKKEAANG